MLSTGSSPERARRVLDQEGWDAFTVVLGSDHDCSKGSAHYDRMAKEATDGDEGWTRHAVTVGDSPQDMRLGAEHGVPVRIGVDRDGDPRAAVRRRRDPRRDGAEGHRPDRRLGRALRRARTSVEPAYAGHCLLTL